MVNQKGQVVKGSGRYPNANNAAAVAKMSAVKRSREYHEAVREFIPVEKAEAGAHALTSLEELLEAAARVATGKPFGVRCPDCKYEFTVNMGVDSKVLVFLLERLLGKATETKDVNIRSEEIVKLLQDESVNLQIEVVALDPRERAERARVIEASFAD